MKRKYIRIFLLLAIVLLAFTGYLKGCNSHLYPKQHPISSKHKDSLNHFIPDLKDSTIKVAAGEHYKKNELHEIFYGEHYRDLWALPVEMKVFDISKEKGGLKIIKRGGSMQTLNLRMERADGKKYVLRTIDKDQAMALPSLLKNKILIYLIRDQTSALNPYGALVVPRLADAAGLYHTNPELFFIPYDKRFGEYAELFEGRVAILEEYPDISWVDTEKFKGVENILSTSDMLAARYSSQNVRIDEKEFAKARLFDLFINDWDRHVDQWEWAEVTEGNKKIYKPIPRDRDMTFYKFNTGLLPHITLAFNHKFQTFDYNYGDIKGMIKNARYIDGIVLNGITEEEFMKIAQELKNSISDSVIEDAVNAWPKEVIGMMGRETISKLKSRRDKLEYAAKEYYKLLFDEVQLVGTDDEEKFIIDRIDKDHTSVTIENSKGRILYNHIFNHAITREITLYGLNGTDEFEVKGKTDKGIVVKIYGGQDRDYILDESNVKGYVKKTKVYDSKMDNDIRISQETEDLTTYDPSVLYFDRVGVKRR